MSQYTETAAKGIIRRGPIPNPGRKVQERLENPSILGVFVNPRNPRQETKKMRKKNPQTAEKMAEQAINKAVKNRGNKKHSDVAAEARGAFIEAAKKQQDKTAVGKLSKTFKVKAQADSLEKFWLPAVKEKIAAKPKALPPAAKKAAPKNGRKKPKAKTTTTKAAPKNGRKKPKAKTTTTTTKAAPKNGRKKPKAPKGTIVSLEKIKAQPLVGRGKGGAILQADLMEAWKNDSIDFNTLEAVCKKVGGGVAAMPKKKTKPKTEKKKMNNDQYIKKYWGKQLTNPRQVSALQKQYSELSALSEKALASIWDEGKEINNVKALALALILVEKDFEIELLDGTILKKWDFQSGRTTNPFKKKRKKKRKLNPITGMNQALLSGNPMEIGKHVAAGAVGYGVVGAFQYFVGEKFKLNEKIANMFDKTDPQRMEKAAGITSAIGFAAQATIGVLMAPKNKAVKTYLPAMLIAGGIRAIRDLVSGFSKKKTPKMRTLLGLPGSHLSGYEEWIPSLGGYGQWIPSMGGYDQWIPSLGGYGQWIPSLGGYGQWIPSLGGYGQWIPSLGGYDGSQMAGYEEWTPGLGQGPDAGYQLAAGPDAGYQLAAGPEAGYQLSGGNPFGEPF